MADQLIFHPYARSNLFTNAIPDLENGRVVRTVQIALHDDLGGGDASAELILHLMGPADVAGLQPSAIAGTAPLPAVKDAETTKLTHIDFKEIDLPWRYSFELDTNGNQDRPKPWLVLITGTTDELELVGSAVKIKNHVIYTTHNLDSSWMWAHHMHDQGRTVARLLSPRGLENGGLLPNREYIAAVVPAYVVQDDHVRQAWQINGQQIVFHPDGDVLPAYYAWSYWTADAGDFETLAAALHAVDVGTLGSSALTYERNAITEQLDIRGAITSLAASPDLKVANIANMPTTWPVATDPAPANVLEDFARLNTEVTDERRPIVALPTYGIPWITEPEDTDWGRLLNNDPRFRGIAGLGVWLAMEAQEELIDAARQQVGALAETSQRVRQLSSGLNAARSLWNRRLPADPALQLHIVGPTLRRLPATNADGTTGWALDMVTGPNRSLPRSVFSSAARRLLRAGDGISKQARPDAASRPALLAALNTCPSGPARASGHIDAILGAVGQPPLADQLSIVDMPESVAELIRRLVDEAQPIDSSFTGELLLAALSEAIVPPADTYWLVQQRLRPYQDVLPTYGLLYEIVFPFLAQFDQFREDAGEHSFDLVLSVLDAMRPRLEPPCQPVALPELAARASRAISPLGDAAPALLRICKTVEGIDVCNLEPPEVCIGLQYEVWKLLAGRAKSWLLPGIEDLEKDAVVAMESNPAFIDAVLAGLNTQLLAELRWRNLAIAPKCTPLRWFWGKFDYTLDMRLDDIHGIDLWADTRLGDNQHQVLAPNDAAGNRDLVMVFRTDLFRRYQKTQVYLISGDDDDALKAERPDFAGGHAIGPRVKGMIGDDITFFIFDIDPSTLEQYRVILDEPPAELRFVNNLAQTGADAADFAVNVIDCPTRVAIAGNYLEWKGLPE